MSLTLSNAKTKVDAILAKYTALAAPSSVIAPSLTAGKMYEAWVLAIVLERLEVQEGFTIHLIGSSKVHLKSSPGPINRRFPRFELLKNDIPLLEVWTDVEFATLSHSVSQGADKPASAHRHELDVVVVPFGTDGYPRHDAIALGVECKNTSFSKAMARAALGVRRELSLLSAPMDVGNPPREAGRPCTTFGGLGGKTSACGPYEALVAEVGEHSTPCAV
jgi:hypothetical protein